MDYNELYSTIIVGAIGMIIHFAINITIFYIIFSTIIKSVKRATNKKYFKNNVVMAENSKSNKQAYIDITKSELAEFNTDDLISFKNYFYKIFVDFETAYNNLDYNVMRSLSTKQLFQNYYTGISLDLEVGKKRIINSIQRKSVTIYEVFSSTTKQVVSAMIEISYINYIVNKNGNVISGNREHKVTEKFEVIFRKDFEKEAINNCPNCGAALNGYKCEFCNSTIKNSEFKISSIKRIISL